MIAVAARHGRESEGGATRPRESALGYNSPFEAALKHDRHEVLGRRDAGHLERQAGI